MNDLVKSKGELMQRTRLWTALSDEVLRREAVRAANERDVLSDLSLWTLTDAHLTLHGKSGARVSVNTYATYKRGVLDLIEAWQGENLLRPSRDAGVLYVRDLEAKGLKPATVRTKLAAAKALYRALRWSGATTASPFVDVKAAVDKTPAWAKRAAYTAADLRRMTSVADEHNLVILLLGAHAGLRESEMLGLEWRDVDLANASLRIRQGKGNKEGTVPMSRSLVEALAALPKTDPHVLPCRSRFSIIKRVNRLAKRAGVIPRGVHALRHTCGTQLRLQGVDIADVADHLRQATLDTARGYAKAVNPVVKGVVGRW